MRLLNKLRKEYFLPMELYIKLKRSITQVMKQDIEELNDFLDHLPSNLRIETSLYLHEETYKYVFFLKDKSV